MMPDDHDAGWEAFKQKQVLATMQRHPNPYTRWGLTHAPRWLLVYEDVDMPPAAIDDRDEAFLHFAKAEQRGWNCSLFVTERRVPVPEAVGELLAIIHGDGGHYQAEHGVEKAAQDAIAKVNALRQVVAQRISTVQEGSSLRSVAEKLRQGGASLPAPKVTGTIEGSIVTGLSIALAVVEEAIAEQEKT